MNRWATVFTDLVWEVFRGNGLLLAAGDRITQPVGLTSARWQVLGVVEHRPVPVAKVARTMGLSRQSVQRTANDLRREGFITYLENPHHRRAKLMQLTEKGEGALTYISEQQALWVERIGDEHNLEALKGALALLKQMQGSLEGDMRLLERKGRKREA